MKSALDDTRLDLYRTAILNAIDHDDLTVIENIFNEELAVADIAHLLESIPARLRSALWAFVDDDLQGEVLTNLRYTAELPKSHVG